jgi:predicted Rossmann fold flavoprotein
MAGSLLRGDVALIDSNNRVGVKLEISGGGKCNITNTQLCEENYYGNKPFVKAILDHFDHHDLIAYLRQRGLDPVVRDQRFYFCKKSSREIIELLKKDAQHHTFYLNTTVTDVGKNQENFIVKTDRGNLSCKRLIMASGGLSYPKIGASDIAYKVAQTFGHDIITPKPALVGLTVQKDQAWFKILSGISTPVSIQVAGKTFSGDLLFAHKGISGLVVLNASLYWDKGAITIDFLPSHNITSLLKPSKKQIITQLPLPKRFTKEYLKSINLADKPIDQLSDAQKQALSGLKSYTMSPAGNFGFSKAEVTRGGVSTADIDPHTMMSRKVKNLYFIGEALDVTGELGGYNFQWAFSSAMRLLPDTKKL